MNLDFEVDKVVQRRRSPQSRCSGRLDATVEEVDLGWTEGMEMRGPSTGRACSSPCLVTCCGAGTVLTRSSLRSLKRRTSIP